mmetsp:Transcript_88235/g.263086  ORF Transcript_88235/g.263086 Transcript_88235/m.263086 type:complete len:218 (-) Transcript_88235:211-864(-)
MWPRPEGRRSGNPQRSSRSTLMTRRVRRSLGCLTTPMPRTWTSLSGPTKPRNSQAPCPWSGHWSLPVQALAMARRSLGRRRRERQLRQLRARPRTSTRHPSESSNSPLRAFAAGQGVVARTTQARRRAGVLARVLPALGRPPTASSSITSTSCSRSSVASTPRRRLKPSSPRRLSPRTSRRAHQHQGGRRRPRRRRWCSAQQRRCPRRQRSWHPPRR